MVIPKAGIAAIGALGAGTTVYMGYVYVSRPKEGEGKKVTIGEELKGFLLNTESSDRWTSRKTRLSQADENSLVKELRNLKNEVTEAHLKNWCSKASTQVYSEVNSLYLTNVRSYCTFYIEDKLPAGYISGDSSWDEANNRLKGINPDTNLSEQMRIVKEKLSKPSSPENDSLKNWCEEAYKKPYLGEDSQDFKDAKSYCSVVTILTKQAT